MSHEPLAINGRLVNGLWGPEPGRKAQGRAEPGPPEVAAAEQAPEAGESALAVPERAEPGPPSRGGSNFADAFRGPLRAPFSRTHFGSHLWLQLRGAVARDLFGVTKIRADNRLVPVCPLSQYVGSSGEVHGVNRRLGNKIDINSYF